MPLRFSRSETQAPGPGTLSFFFSLPEFRRDPLRGFFDSALRFGDVVRYRGLWTTHQLSHPDHIQRVLQTNAANYRKGRDYQILKLSLGEGLLTSEGALWERQRKMTQPAFHSQQVAKFVSIMERHASAMLDRWQVHADSSQPFDITPDLMHLTLNIASEALFSTSLDADAAVIREVLDIGRDFSVDRAWSVIRLPHTWPTRRNREYRAALGNFHAILDRVIAGRRQSAGRVPDLLTMLMEARDENGNPMSDRQLRDEFATLLTAGHETTTLALAWTCFLLAQHPPIADRVVEEITFLCGRAPAYDDLFRLKYTRSVIEESMRLYPPVWVISRTAIAEDVIGPFRIPAGSEILIFPYITHRHPQWWTEPDAFRPERFSSSHVARPRFAYLPFGAGPRTCVGLNFAMTEIQVVLALLLQRFQLHLAMDPATVRAEPSVTLRPNPGVRLLLHKISGGRPT